MGQHLILPQIGLSMSFTLLSFVLFICKMELITVSLPSLQH